VMLAAAAGVGSSVAYALYVSAMRIGHYGLSAAILSASFMLGVLFAVIFLGDQMTLARGVGIALLLVAVFMIATSSSSSRLEAGSHWGKWAIFMTAAFFLNGMPMIGQTVVSKFKAPVMPFIMVMYISGFLALLPMTIGKGRIQPGTLILGTLAAAGSMTGCICCILAMGQFASGASIALPVATAGPMLVAILASRIIFKEKIRPLGYFGVACQVAGIVLLGIASGTH